jgi:hypothetical protein
MLMKTWSFENTIFWLVVWNIFYFPCIGNVIIPTDELDHFSEGFKPPTSFQTKPNMHNHEDL